MRKVLIANRGEIAVRVARACAEYGVASVAVYADADADAPHARLADEAYALPDGYLDVDGLLDVAARAGADAVHPGYGFLSESAAAAARVEEAGLVWIGPTPATIARLGDKALAREVARSVGAPLAPGSDGPVGSADDVVAFAREHGLPVMIKAAHGGGGRGLRVVRRLEEVTGLYDAAAREAAAAFGRGECLVEKYLERPRHVEVQVLGDGTGGVVVLGTRDCSVQRRSQKLVEEAPAPFLTSEQEQVLTTAARDICAAVGYRSAGTVELLLDADGLISFLEVNTRLQVEHTVTEETTDIDLVRQQLLLADGRPVEVTEDVRPSGHAIELRITAEDPGRGFLPGPGTLTRFDPPGGPGVRVDAGVVAGSTVPASFDSLVAKLVVRAPDRTTALRRARAAVASFTVEGVPTVLPFHVRLLEDPAFTAPSARSFAVHTRWVEDECTWLDELGEKRAEPPHEDPVVRTWVEIDGRRSLLGLPTALLAQLSTTGHAQSPDPAQEAGTAPDASSDGDVSAPAAGILTSWSAPDGERVEAGERVAVVEAMKTERPIAAPLAGVLRHVVTEGAQVGAGDRLGVVEP
ncbi:acetyl/propionyl/methylcrotonyl-CoA carboxylase subunit alpha [Georgenia halophila]|uniref:biotin carboxylase n=1 Tax=Georgenia halophila TaxID=620889 RepID=A0ABP8L9K4_9MICO